MAGEKNQDKIFRIQAGVTCDSLVHYVLETELPRI